MIIPRLAIIDDGVSHLCIPDGQPFECYIADEHGVTQSTKPESLDTHASVCYSMFKNFVQVPYHLISVKVINHETGMGSKNALLSALHWCKEQNIDLISMSIGTRQYLDFAQISEAVNALSKTIIIAACNNQNTLTYPACLPNVLGVHHCPEEAMRGKFAYIPTSYDQIELMTCAGNASNSSAVPIMAARVCEYIANGLCGLEDIRQKLKEDAMQDTSFLNYEFFKNLLPEWGDVQVPVIILPYDIPKGVDRIKPLIAAFIQDGYRVAVLSQSHETCVVSHIYHLSWQFGEISMSELIKLYYNFTLPDILFLHIKSSEVLLSDITADIVFESHWLYKNTQCLFLKIKGMLS